MDLLASPPVNVKHTSHIYEDVMQAIQVRQIDRIETHCSWSIKNFLQHLSIKSGEFLLSDVFYSGSDENFGWYMKLFPNVTPKLDCTQVNLYLQPQFIVTEKKLNISCDCSVLCNNISIYSTKLKTVIDESICKGIELLRSESLRYKLQHMLPPHVLTIKIKMKITSSVSNLIEDLDALLQNGKYSDFTLIVDKQRVKVHKNILATRSSYFQALFDSGMQENVQDEVEIPDFSLPVIKEMLRYIYTGILDSDCSDILTELMIAADKYNLERLKSLCEKELLNCIDKDNAIDILETSKILKATELQSRVLEFIEQNLKDVALGEFFMDKELVRIKGDLLADIIFKLAHIEQS